MRFCRKKENIFSTPDMKRGKNACLSLQLHSIEFIMCKCVNRRASASTNAFQQSYRLSVFFMDAL